MKVSPDIKKRLKISYDALSEEEQKIFLDITPFFHRRKQNKCHNILERIRLERIAGAYRFRGLKNVIHMHDQLGDLGRQIAEEETPRRLWRPTGDIDEWLHKYSSFLDSSS